MRKAFATLGEEDDDDEDEDDLCDHETDSAAPVAPAVPAAKHLRCFAHSLQLLIKDGLKDSKPLYGALGKCSKIASLLHSSSSFQEKFESVFGKQRGIAQANATRWNSTLTHISSILKLEIQPMNTLLQAAGQNNLKFKDREWNMLEDLQRVLLPFLEATMMTQGDKSVTTSYVLPSIMMLFKHLDEFECEVGHLTAMKRTLLRSMQKRFSGID